MKPEASQNLYWYNEGRADLTQEAVDALNALTAFSQIAVTLAYDEGLAAGEENCEQEYQEGFKEGKACAEVNFAGVRKSMQAEKSALHNEVQRLRVNNETLRREISNLRIKLDEAKG